MLLGYLAAIALACITSPPGLAHVHRWPTSSAARVWRPPAGFIWQAWCIHRHESVDWHRAWLDWQGNRSRYAGGMQFLESTWQHAGGRGEPWQWSPREQIFRAFRVVRRDGGWREWGSRARCGL